MKTEKTIKRSIEERTRLQKIAEGTKEKAYLKGWIMALQWVLED